MTTDRSPFPRFVWAPLPVLLLLMAVFVLARPAGAYYTAELLTALELVFVLPAAVAVAVLMGRSFWLRGAPGLLWVGGGVLIWALAGLVGMAATGRDLNFAVTVYNISLALAAFAHLAGVVSALGGQPPVRAARRRPLLVLAFLSAPAVVALVAAAAVFGPLPVFFVQGEGGTPIQHVVLLVTVLLLVLTAVVLLSGERRRESAFARWYSLGLLLLAGCALAIMLQRNVGSAVFWTGRAMEYAAGVYLVLAALAARKAPGGRISLADALHEREAQLAAVLDNLPVGIWIVDAAGRVTAKNGAANLIWRGDAPDSSRPEDYVEYAAWDVETGKRLEANDYPLARTLRTGLPIAPAELRIRRFDGTEGFIMMSTAPLRGLDGSLTGAVGINVDVTERKQVEQQLAWDLDAMTRLQELGTLFVREGNLEQILGNVVEVAIAIAGADFGNIQLLDPAAGDLRIAAQRGFQQWWLDFWESVAEGRGCCGTALERGERVIVEDVAQSPIFAGTPALDIHLKAGVRAMQSTPLLSRPGKPLGMLSTHYRKPGRPDDRALRLLDLLARQAADIIERAQSEVAVHRLARFPEENPNPVLRVSAEGTVLYCNPAATATPGWTCEIDRPLGEPFVSLVRRAMTEGQQAKQDVKLGGRFYAVWVSPVPSEHYANIYGRDITDRKQAEAALREAKDKLEMRVEERTADLTQMNARLKQEIEERERYERSLRLEEARLDALLHLGRMTEAPLAEITNATLDQAIALTQSKIGFVGFVNEDQTIYTLSSVSKDVVKECAVEGDPREWAVADAGIWADAIRQRKTLFVNDYNRPDPRKHGLPHGHVPVERFMAVPILEDGKVVAVAGVGNKGADYDAADERQVFLLLNGMWSCVQKNRAREQLQAERQRLFDVLEAIPAMVCLLTPDYHVAFANRSFRERFGESDGRHCYEFCFGRSEPCEFCETYKVLETGRPHRWEVAGPDGTVIDAYDVPFTGADGGRLILEMDLDITEQRRNEGALVERSDQLRALANELTRAEQVARQQLARILHDNIQQLLVAARMQLSLAKRADPEFVQSTVQGVDGILAETLEACRSLTVELCPPVLHQTGLVAALSWLAARMEGMQQFKVLVRASSDAEPSGFEERAYLFDATREILLNAAKHSGASGAEVTMLRTKDDCCRIIIEDKGRGFDPSSVKPGRGGGFGLFAVQQRLPYIGGKLEIESAPGRGTRAVLTAPIRRAAGQGSAPGAPSADGAAPQVTVKEKGQRIRVLLVDDHQIMRQGLSSMLQFESDLEIVGEAENGQQAIEMARRHKPDVVIMDVNMPVMNGAEATKVLAHEMPNTKVIALSMHIDKESADAMREAGAAAYLTKGGPSEDLIEAIRTSCRRRPAVS